MEKLIINEENNRFELEVDGHIAFLEFKSDGKVFKLIHTEVPSALEGKGVGKKLVSLVMDYLRDHDLKMVPLCSFVVALLRRHPEWNDLVAER